MAAEIAVDLDNLRHDISVTFARCNVEGLLRVGHCYDLQIHGLCRTIDEGIEMFAHDVDRGTFLDIGAGTEILFFECPFVGS